MAHGWRSDSRMVITISRNGKIGFSNSDEDRPRYVHSRHFPDYYAFYDTPISEQQLSSPGVDAHLALALTGNRSPSPHSMSSPLLNTPTDRHDEYHSNPLGPVDVDSSFTYLRDGKTTQQQQPYLSSESHIPASNPSILDDLRAINSPLHLTKSNGTPRPSKPLFIETLYFRDGRRKIDFVLAYEDNGEQHGNSVRRRQRRAIFQENIEEEGLDLELEDKKHSQDGRTYFLKIHAPWEVLTRYAELMNLKMPIKENDQAEEFDPLMGVLPCLINLSAFEYDKLLIPDEPHYYTCAFNRERSKQFLIKSKDTFFSNGQRAKMVYEVLVRARYDNDDMEKMGIQRLVSNGSYTAAFSLHDGSYTKKEVQQGYRNNRRMLYQEWARIKCFYKMQPLPLIRKYFGEKIGIYFAWLGFYTYMLIAPAIVGVLCFFYGLISLPGDTPIQDICDEKGLGNTTMCPICEECPCKQLADSCDIAKVTYLFDNNATVFFSVFMSFWATLFLEFWKRYQSRIAWEWDLANFDEEEEGLNKLQENQENQEKAKENAAEEEEDRTCTAQTNEKAGYSMKSCKEGKATRIVATGSCILLMLLIALATVLGVITYRIIIVSRLMRSNDEFFRDNASWISSISAACLNFLFIVILDKVYHKIAKWLTNLEQPRTQTEYENSFTFKMFLFQFINFYSSLIYIAFFKGKVKTEDHSPVMIDQCDPTGCMFELVIQLAIIMAGKQILNNINEILTPVILNWYRSHKSKSRTSTGKTGLYTRWEQDYDLAALDRMALFDEYIEMVIQYGFVTLFVSAFPLAPLFALLNNIVEIRLDAYKFVTQVRRPIAARAQDIGVWLGILKGLSILSVMSNAFVLAYTSDFIPRMVYVYYYSKDGSYVGYISSSLSLYNTSDAELPGTKSVDKCWYVDHRRPPEDDNKYSLTLEYWHIFAARLAFVVIYEHLVFSLTGVVAYLIPDAPADVKAKLLKEKILAKEALYEAELEKVRRERMSRRNQAESGFDSGSLVADSRADLHVSTGSQTEIDGSPAFSTLLVPPPLPQPHTSYAGAGPHVNT